MSEVLADICTRSTALLVTFAAVSESPAAALGSATGWGGVSGCKSTRTELLPGWRVRCESPATTSTSRGGKTVRAPIVAPGGASESEGGSGLLASGASRCFAAWCFGLALLARLATPTEGCTAGVGAWGATGEL